jgi:glycosyltransferase involved in cell wall biosynthesis
MRHARARGSVSASRAAIHLITCEYPPDIGGVADHTRALASGLAAAGACVHVWCPPGAKPIPAEPGIDVHVLPDRFGARALRALQRGLDAEAVPRRIFVQWVPHGYGRRSLNLPFCTWLLRRARVHGDHVDVMVHEAYLAFDRRRLRQSGAALAHRVMLTTLFAAATSVWLATPSFDPYVRPYGLGRTLGYRWLPLPSPLACTTDRELTARIRRRWPSPVVAHFGTFNPLVTTMLASAVQRVLEERPDATWLLIGRDGERFAGELARHAPHIARRVTATGTLDPDTLSAHVLAADVFVQPYPDGVTARRTTATALLAHGRPIVTTDGHLTEPFWRTDGAVRLTRVEDRDALAAATILLLDDADARARLADRAIAMFEGRFSTARAIAALQATG